MRRVDIEREHQEGTYKERKHEKRVNIWRKRNEKHKDKKEEDQHGNLNRENFCCQGIPQMRLTKRKRNLFSKK